MVRHQLMNFMESGTAKTTDNKRKMDWQTKRFSSKDCTKTAVASQRGQTKGIYSFSWNRIYQFTENETAEMRDDMSKVGWQSSRGSLNCRTERS